MPGAAAPARGGYNRALLWVLGIALGGSGFGRGRIEFGPFLIHPIMFLVSVMLPVLLVQRARWVKANVVTGLAAFAAAQSLAMLSDGDFYYPPVVKFVSVSMVLVTVALLVNSEEDYVTGVVAMMFGVSIIAVHGIVVGAVGVETFSALERANGNKNAFSLYALPVMLLGAEVLLKRRASLIQRITLAVGWVVLAMTIFLSANRSGWVGVILIVFALVVASGRRVILSTAFLSVAGAATYFIMSTWFDTGVFQRRLDQTFEGYSSDDLREALFVKCFEIGLENPILGVGPKIDYELAHRIPGQAEDALGPHNAITALFGIGGVVLVAAWLLLGRQLWRAGNDIKDPGRRFSVMHWLIAVWVFRAAFTDEALYSPAFAMAFGLLVGLSWARGRAKSARLSPALAAAPVRPRAA